MKCLNCEKETTRLITEKYEEGGIVKTLVYCPLCPRTESPAKNFPSIIVKGRKNGRDSLKVKKENELPDFDLLENKQRIEVWKRRVPKAQDDELQRHLVNYDLVRKKKIATVAVGSYGNVNRAKKVHNELRTKLETEDYTIKKDDGLLVTAEVNH